MPGQEDILRELDRKQRVLDWTRRSHPAREHLVAFSSLVTATTPGVAADSNRQMHGLGDHAENSVSLDGQTDQFSKIFSNQIPSDSIQSMELISGAPPAEFGDKTSLVIKVTTRSGLGVARPTGSLTAAYGSFGTANVGFDLAYGGNNWGNFFAVNGLNTSRFLDPPEFQALHDKGNEENIFDRIDYQLKQTDTLHFNLGFTCSWFDNPNSYDQQYHRCGPIGYTCAPTATFIINNLTGVPDPQRIAPRHLFDMAMGHDNLFHGDRFRWSLEFTVINLTDKVALSAGRTM